MLNLALSALILLLLLTTGTAERVRLVGSRSIQEGRLEVYHDGVWGTVCDSGFTDAVARVVCHMLGFGYTGWFIGNNYGAGSGTIWLTNVRCNGTETSLADCQHDSWGLHHCSHYEDVSVKCITEVRLVEGSSSREGRLEVYHNDAWGTVCHGGFTDAAARVVCYMLGYGRDGRFIGDHYSNPPGDDYSNPPGDDYSNPPGDDYSNPPGDDYSNPYSHGSTTWLNEVRCNGMETNIADCQHLEWGTYHCHYSAEVSVSCITVRLVDGPSSHEGRLEVYHNGIWGTVCQNYFTHSAAKVVCYMLGYGHGGYDIANRYGSGGGRIWLDNVRCRGTETNIANCRHLGWGNHNCGHHLDVSVSCITVRLVNLLRVPLPLNLGEGRLEVYHNGTWGTVCHNNFTHAAAKVVCHMLGYVDVGQYIGSRYGAGSGTIWLDNVQCNGTETNVANCRHLGWGIHRCGHQEDVSVSCFNEVRLAGSSGSKGRLEVYRDGTWGTVCDNGFTDAAARIVCYSLGHGRTGRFIGNSYGAGSGRIWLDNVRCGDLELHIAMCYHSGWGVNNCSHSDDVSVSCVANSTEAVTLVGGGNPRVGRLELFHANQWGTVCNEGFTDAAARVVCYSLGFGYVGRKVDIELFGVGDGLIWLSNINCIGSEQHIGECSHGDWGVHQCVHREDVAVSCTDNTSAADDSDSTTSVTPVRLVGGSSSRGRLEVLHGGLWGTVCGDFFTAAVARVVCKMLGLGSGSKTDNRNYRTSRGPIWLDDVRCSGTETDIAECSHNGWGVHNCRHHEDVAVSCAGIKVEVRLNGGRDPREGRVEVFYNGTWGTVCIHESSFTTARVVCDMLGYGYIGRPITHHYDAGAEVIWLNSVQCTGTEASITECRHNNWGVSPCGPDKVKAVSCLRNGTVVLVGGDSPRKGRLEVFHGTQWGTVCDDGFTDAAARVVCYSLGFGYIGREMNVDIYGVGNGMIWLDDVDCDGNERHIGDCSHRGWGAHDCTHSEDVAVSCVGDSPAIRAVPISSPSSTVTSVIWTSSGTLTDFSRSRSSTSTSSATLTDSSRSSSTTSSGTLTDFSRSRSSTSTSSATLIDSSRYRSTTTSSGTLTGFSRSRSRSRSRSSTSTSSSTLTDSSILLNQIGSNHDASDTTYMGLIIALAVVGAILLIICVVAVIVVVVCQYFRIEMHSRRNPRQEPREVSMIPMRITASTGRCIDDVLGDAACGNRANDTEASNNNAYSNFQQSSAPVAGAVGCVSTGDISYDPFTRYEALPEA